MATGAMVPSNELFTLCSYYTLKCGGSAAEQPKKKKEAAAEDEDFDLFGTGDSEADAKAAQQLAQQKKEAAAAAGKGKKKVINKSMLVIEVKPAAADTNLDEVLQQVKKIHMEGLTWGEGFKKVPVAFGLYKLQVQCVIVDDLVNTNALVDMIEEIGMTEEEKKKRETEREEAEGQDEDEEDEDEEMGLVQSAEIVSFNKL